MDEDLRPTMVKQEQETEQPATEPMPPGDPTYDSLVERCQEAAAMTRTPAWRAFWRQMQGHQTYHKEMCCDPQQKPRVTQGHQDAAHTVTEIMDVAMSPFRQLMAYHSAPLFRAVYPVRASIDYETGVATVVVGVTDIDPWEPTDDDDLDDDTPAVSPEAPGEWFDEDEDEDNE